VTHAASPFRRPDARSAEAEPSDADTAVLPVISDISVSSDRTEGASQGAEGAPERADGEPDLLAEPPLDDDLNARIARAAPRRLANRATYVLAGVALLVAGFVAGAQVQKSYGTAPAASAPGGTNPAALASAFANRGGQGFPGAGGNAGGGGAATGARGGVTGTVKLVDGTTVYIETADGTTVIVKTTDKTTVSTPGALKDLTAGSTVTVQGQTADGSVAATSITKTK
jgi:hypothetical protein